jgi:hypothetical protein
LSVFFANELKGYVLARAYALCLSFSDSQKLAESWPKAERSLWVWIAINAKMSDSEGMEVGVFAVLFPHTSVFPGDEDEHQPQNQL